jgi:hypothetical protein
MLEEVQLVEERCPQTHCICFQEVMMESGEYVLGVVEASTQAFVEKS